MERILDSIRNVLRKEGITGMDSINHCIVFLLSRLMTEKLCEKIGIDKRYAFDNMMKDESNPNDEVGLQELYEKFYIKTKKECFIYQIREVLGFKNINFKLEGTSNLMDIMESLGKLNIEHLKTKYDLIGIVYELHLRSGTSSAMRDLGQYYTNRMVINYMIKLCDPCMTKGKIEKIVDPTMGTGGFLTMAIKYLNDKYKDEKINWKKNKNNIIGFDIDSNVRNMALLNILLEIGEMCNETICKQDTLRNDLMFDNGSILEKAKIILANEPMGLKNIKHAECCERIKELKIRGTKAEPLFLQLFMELLDDLGRCAVIVPDGMLFNESNQHKETRKYLIENFNLKKVVALADDFFLNTGVKTSILFFTKGEETTKEVQFCEIKLKNGEIEESETVIVSYEKIKDNDYSLFVNKYNVEEIEKIEGIEYKKIKNICEFQKKSKRPASFGNNEGKYPFYTSSNVVKYCDEFDYEDESIIIGTGGNANVKIDKKFSCSADNVVLNSNDENILTKYIYYFIMTNIEILAKGFKGSTIKHISKTYIEDLIIPIPSIIIQEKIIERLDVLSENNKTCDKIIGEFEKIIKYYVECESHNGTIYEIGDICDTESGEYIKSGDFEEGEYPVYGGGGVSKYINKKNRENTFIIAKDGVSEKCIRYVNGEFFLNHHGWTLKFKDQTLQIDKYIYYWLIANEQKIFALAKGSAQKGINRNSFYGIEINIPEIKIQKNIVDKCEKTDSLISKLEKQQKINNKMMKKILENYISNI